MEGKERRVGQERMRERGLTREAKDRSIHPETLIKCRGEKTVCVLGGHQQKVGRLGGREGFTCLVGEKRGGTAWAGEL